MENPSIAIATSNLSTPARPSATRKRSRSTVEIFTLPLAYDTKRARIGIQELSTDPTPKSLPVLQESTLLSLPRLGLSQGAESDSQTLEEEYGTSSLEESDDEETTSSSDEESSSETLGEEGYDSDAESGSTTTSSSSSSSDDDSDDDEDGTSSSRSVTIGFPSPEQTRPPTFGSSGGPSALAKRLHSFLPQLAAANKQLDQEREEGRLDQRNIEDVDEEGRYIEMNLGLGVLEEKQDGVSNDSDNDGDESEAGSRKPRTKKRSKKHDAMTVLMGQKAAKKPEIHVVDGT